MKRALYTGSFDPMTIGHLDIIRRAAGLFDELTIGVISNPRKASLFTLEEREELIRQATSDLKNVTVDHFSGLLADYVNAKGFDAVVRGLRGTADMEYELQMAHVNARLFAPGTESVFLMTSPEYAFISSSIVKEVASLGGDIEGLVPENVLSAIKNKYSKDN